MHHFCFVSVRDRLFAIWLDFLWDTTKWWWGGDYRRHQNSWRVSCIPPNDLWASCVYGVAHKYGSRNERCRACVSSRSARWCVQPCYHRRAPQIKKTRLALPSRPLFIALFRLGRTLFIVHVQQRRRNVQRDEKLIQCGDKYEFSASASISQNLCQ